MLDISHIPNLQDERRTGFLELVRTGIGLAVVEVTLFEGDARQR